MFQKTNLVAALFVLFCQIALAQPPGYKETPKKPEDYGIRSKQALGWFQDGQQSVSHRDYQLASDQYEKAIQIEPEFAHAHYGRGISLCLLKSPLYGAALPHLEKAVALRPAEFPLAYFYIGEAFMARSDFAKAVAPYKKFLEQKKMSNENIMKARISLRKAEFAVEAMKNPIKFEPVNMGPEINTAGEEYMPSLTADGNTLFFTSRREGCLGGYSSFYRSFLEDFYFTTKKDGKWQPALNLGPPVNTERNEGAASFSPDGQWVFFTGCEREDGQGNCDIYMAKLVGETWTQAQNLGPAVNSVYWDSQPCISNDGRTLYFASARPGGLGGSDIWYSTLVNGQWTKPKNMEAPINTSGDEFNPFLHADDITLYYSSNLHNGFGASDVFISKRGLNGWSEPQNLGYPFNTPSDEQGIVVNAAGTHAYFSSDRDSEFGKNDIYMFELDPRIRPEFASFVRGVVTDSLTNLPLGSRISFINLETGDTVRQVGSNTKSGKFLLSLPIEKDYAAFFEAPGYAFTSFNFSLKGFAESKQKYFDLNVKLKPIKVGEIFVLNNIFFEFDKFDLKPESNIELDKLVTFLKENKKVTIELRGHTDNQGADDYNLTLSDKRAKAARDYLVQKGIAAARIEANGYGKKVPLAANDTEAGRAQNRRTEVKILKTE